MKKICKERIRLERSEKSREEALSWAAAQNEPYKAELINDLPLMPSSASTPRANLPTCAPVLTWTTPAVCVTTVSS